MAEPKMSNSEKELDKFVSKKTCASKIIVTGASGYVGSNLIKFLKGAEYDVYGVTSKEMREEKIYRLDLIDSQKLLDVLNLLKPNVIFHTAALSSLSECEKNPELAMRINVEATRNIIDAIRNVNLDIKLVFLSSDYVFDGRKGNYNEDDAVNPQTFYGKTKMLSESDVKKYLENYIICRTANIYGKGGIFFNFVLAALEKNKTIDVYDDVFYTPTYIDYLLDSLRQLIEIGYKGVIHIAGSERVSRYDFALKMAEILEKDKTLIRPIKQNRERKLIAKDSSLNCEHSRKILKNYWPSIEESLHYCFGNLIPPYFYSVNGRGKFVGIFQGHRWKEINYVESIKGSVRGNHYHKETKEGFFIIDGKISVTLIDVMNRSKKAFIANKGDTFLVNPNTLHTFEILENSKWINMLSKPFNTEAKDIHTYHDEVVS